MRILFMTNIPAPYVVDYLNELCNYATVTALFELDRATDRQKEWYKNEDNKFEAIFLRAIRTSAESGFSIKTIKYLKKGYDKIIIANPTTPTGIATLLYCRWNKIRYVIQSEGGFQGSGRGIKEYFKKYIMERAEFYLTGMGTENDYFLMYGATKEKLKWYPFSSMRQDMIDKESVSEKKQNEIREMLQMSKKVILLSVGRFIEGKGFDLLLKVATLMTEIEIYLIGDEAPKEYLDIMRKNNITNIHFVDFCDFKKLKLYYHASDFFVLPTRGDTWGLVINEAMASGLPVITTNKCVAGIQLIKDGVNGYIVESDNINELIDKIKILADNKKLRKEMSRNNIEKIKEYSIENMAYVIYRHLEEAY